MVPDIGGMYYCYLLAILIIFNVNSQEEYPTHLHYPIEGKRSMNDGRNEHHINNRPRTEEKIECASTSTHGRSGKFEWWYIQFRNDPVYVTRLRIYSQLPNGKMNLHNIRVTVGDQNNYLENNTINAHGNYICNEIESPINSRIFDINCSYPLLGKIVSIEMFHGCTERSNCTLPTILNLCEVEIYGYQLKDIIEERIDFENDEMAVKQSSFVPYAGPSLAIVEKKENHYVNFYNTSKHFVCAHYMDFQEFHVYQLPLNDLNEITSVTFMANEKIPDPLIIEIFVDVQEISQNPIRSYGNCGYFVGLPKKINTVNCREKLYGKYVKLQVSRQCEMEGKCENGFDDGLQHCSISAKGYPVKNYAIGKDTKQSRTHYDGISLLANDQEISGGFNPYNFLYSCTYATEKYNHPWWQIDLESEHLVMNLLIYNMMINSSLLHDVEIRIGNNDISTFYKIDRFKPFESNTVCKNYSSKALSPGGNFISCAQPLIGRYISIQIINNCTFTECRTHNNINVLALCEVEVYGTPIDNYYFGDVALGKSLTSGVLNKGTTYLSWWVLNLDSVHAVRRIDAFITKQLRKKFHVEIHVGFVNEVYPDSTVNTVFNSTEVCFIADKLDINSALVLNCNSPIIGKYVTILIEENCIYSDGICGKPTLSIDFIEVWATKFKKFNLERKKTFDIDWSSRNSIIREQPLQAIQSSIREPQCARTNAHIYPWWQIDFLYDVIIESVSIWNTEDNFHGLLHDIEIRVGPEDNSKFGDKLLERNNVCIKTNEILPKGKSIFHCRYPLPGRFLTIQIVGNCTSHECPNTHRNILTLCKVSAEGNYIDITGKATYNLARGDSSKSTSLSDNKYDSTLAIDGKIPPLTIV